MVRVPPDVPLAIKQAIAALDSASPAERKAAVETLAQTNHPAAREALAKAMQHPVQDVRIRAALMLAKFEDVRAMPSLIEALRNENRSVRRAAARALVTIGNAAVPGLITALCDTGMDMREAITDVLEWIIGETGVSGLLDALRDENDDVLEAVAKVLAEFGGTDIVPDLITALRDEDYQVRKTAAEALKQVGTPEAMAAVEEWSRRQQGGSTRGPIRRGIRKP